MSARSIRQRVLVSALAVLAIGAALLVAAAWWMLQQEMGEVFEDNLKQVALAVATHPAPDGSARPRRLAQQLPRIYEEHGQFDFVVQVWTPDGRRIHGSDERVALPFTNRSGLATVAAAGDTWHVYTVVLEDGVVQSAQRASERESLARETASGLVVPALLVLVVTAGLLAVALRRGLAPLSQAALEVTSRGAGSLTPIETQAMPIELQPLAHAINGLMARLGNALAVQRHFVADAAHELRTPIAALRLQLQLLERARDETQRRESLAELAAGIQRAQHLVEQLLQLSRLGPEAPQPALQRISLAELARSAVAQFSARAEQQQVDLGAVAEGDPQVRGDPQQLAILLNNLVENALRHTPRSGRVDVAAASSGARAQLRVCDSGPGIPAAERERVFDRFYRGANAAPNGSGLGLAIVKAVADRHGATVSIGDAEAGGLEVTVSFPAA